MIETKCLKTNSKESKSMRTMSTEVHAKIADVVARYADYCDHGKWGDAAGLFTHDGVFDARDVFGEIVEGRPALEEFMSTRPTALAHHPTTFYVEDVKDGEYHVRMKMLVVFDGAVSSIDYRWVMVPAGDDMQVARQEIAMVGRLKTGTAR